MDSVLSLLDRMETVILRGEPVPRTGRRMIDEQEVLGLLSMARAQLPADLRRAQHLRSEAEVVQQRAGDEARRIIEAANEESRRIREGADDYAAAVLDDLEARIGRVLETIRRGKEVLGARL